MPWPRSQSFGGRDQRRRRFAVERLEHAPLAGAGAHMLETSSSTWALMRPTTRPPRSASHNCARGMLEPGVLARASISPWTSSFSGGTQAGIVLVDLPGEVDEGLAVGFGGDRADE